MWIGEVLVSGEALHADGPMSLTARRYALFRTQRIDRVDRRGAAGGNVAGEQG